MKLKHIAAALAVLAAGTANAAIATGGNGSLVMIAFDKTGGTTTAGVFDLGLTMDDLIGATGNGSGVAATSLAGLSKNLEWNFVNNTIKVNGTVTSFGGANNWTAAWNTLLANSDAAELSFVVTAFDTVGVGANLRSLVTGKPNSSFTFSATAGAALTAVAGGKANDIFTPIANKGTIASAANGAYTFTAADGATTRANGYVMAGDGFANEWRNVNQMKGETLASATTSLYVVDGAGKKFELDGSLSLNAANGTLTLAVPEPSSYAMMIAGLAVAGVVARRRRAV